MNARNRAATVLVAGVTLLPSLAMAQNDTPLDHEPVRYSEAPRDWLAALTPTSTTPPSYANRQSDLIFLDNGMVLEGGDLETPDGFTSGFRLTASYSPTSMPLLDIGAEFTYRESEEVPIQQAEQALLVNTTTMGGSLLAGVRLGQFGLYAKSGFAEWEGDPVTRGDTIDTVTAGSARIQGFGARLKQDRMESRLEFEEIDAPDMDHLNLLTASFHYAF